MLSMHFGKQHQWQAQLMGTTIFSTEQNLLAVSVFSKPIHPSHKFYGTWTILADMTLPLLLFSGQLKQFDLHCLTEVHHMHFMPW